MNHHFILTDEILWDYADGFLSPEEKKQVEARLKEHPDSQARLDHILMEKRSFATFPLEKPESGFTQQVMHAWTMEQKPVKNASKVKHKDWIFWGAAGILLMLLFTPFLLAPDAPATEPVRIPEKFVPQITVPSYDWTGLLNSNLTQFLLLITLALLGLKLLDKYLQVRYLHTAR
ncbi:MAG TPA: hypothetical protein DCF33_13095 [Saprospirales bacterium]|nr:hypothetical protein [Saprospirales bacterium]